MNTMPILATMLGKVLVAMPAWAAGADLPLAAPLPPPVATSIPAGPLGDAIRYGQQIVNATQTTVKAFTGNGLNCASCHLDGGRTAEAAPFVGLTGLFPEYRSLRGSVESLEERINDGMVRASVAAAFVQAKMPLGNAGALTDQEAYDIAAYFTTQPRPGYPGTRDDWPNGGRPADAR